MATFKKPLPGEITWVDLTVEHAVKVRDFYSKVIGWKPVGVDMGGYKDFSMNLRGSGQDFKPAVSRNFLR